jgi:hypothetical protein
VAFLVEIDAGVAVAQNPADRHCRRCDAAEKSSMRRLGVLLIAWLAIACSLSARDLYVDNVGGDDRFDGGSPAARGGKTGPCRTIACALRKCSRGDRIVLAASGQPYRESITLQAARHSGVTDRPFEIVGNGAILEGAAPVPGDAWEHMRSDVYRFSPPRKAFQMLFLDGKPADRVAVDRGELSLPELKPLQWCLFERYVYFRTETGRRPDSYRLEYAALPVGVTLYEVRNVVIRDLIVQGFQLDGVNAHDSVFDASIVGVTCRGNARSGISVGGASRVRLEACLLGNNGTAQLRTEGYSHTRVVGCDLLDNTAPPVKREGGKVTVEEAESQPAGQVTSRTITAEPADKLATAY